MPALTQPGLEPVPSGLQNPGTDHQVTTGQNKNLLLSKFIMFALYESKETILLLSNKSDSDMKVNFTLYLVITIHH